MNKYPNLNVLIIGSSGTIGTAIYNSLNNDYRVFGAHRASTQYPVDLTDPKSIRALFENLPPLDGVINVTGDIPVDPFDISTEEEYYNGIMNKLVGQVNLVHVAKNYLNANAFIILTAGIYADYPLPNSNVLSLINNALYNFFRNVYPFLKNGIKLNIVLPGAIEDRITEMEVCAKQNLSGLESLVSTYRKALLCKRAGMIFKA